MYAGIFLFVLNTLQLTVSCAGTDIETAEGQVPMKDADDGSTFALELERWLHDSKKRVFTEESCPCVKPQCLGSGSCPTGYSAHPVEQFCYRLYPSCLTWAEARQVCKRDGGDLISLKASNFDFFKTAAKTQSSKCSWTYVWVGASDISVEGQWYWLNGERVNAGFWTPGEPNQYLGQEEDCAGIDYWSFRLEPNLNDINCSLSSSFICQIC